uniref:Uncharacterized protein n=1 Tax=Amphimedon queenslandica TaxID=400682 RepID=A0A1X7SNS6_AMPQE
MDSDDGGIIELSIRNHQRDEDNGEGDLASGYSSMEGSTKEYKKAALLVKEGRDNERFDSMPEQKRAWIAYRILHNPFYYWLALILAVAIMLLAILEEPSTQTQKTERSDKAVHLLSEVFLLSFFTTNLILRF